MALFGFLNKAKDILNKQVNPAYGQNKDFLEAVCAAAAFVASADGSIDDSEKKATIQLLANHKTLGQVYSSTDIRSTADIMFSRANSASGKAQLVRELEDLNNTSGTGQMKEDVYWIAVDVASADGNVSPEEATILTKLASRLGVSVDADGGL